MSVVTMRFEANNRGWMMLDYAREQGLTRTSDNAMTCKKVSSSKNHLTLESDEATLRGFSKYLKNVGISHFVETEVVVRHRNRRLIIASDVTVEDKLEVIGKVMRIMRGRNMTIGWEE